MRNGLPRIFLIMKKICIAALALLVSLSSFAQKNAKEILRTTDEAFFKTKEAARIGDELLLWQRNTGGWPKNYDMTVELSPEQKTSILSDKSRTDDSTIDNDATTIQLSFLARLYAQSGGQRYRDSFRKGIAYLLEAQYDNGGWPQFYPKGKAGYSTHITYNDEAMENVLDLFRDIVERKSPYDNAALVDEEMRARVKASFEKGIECILATQIVQNGELTVWCQQHDENTLLPAKARAYELPSFCSLESAYLVKLLMELDNPDDRVKRAVHSAMKWFDEHKISGYDFRKVDGKMSLVPDAEAKPIWARFYDLENGEPFVCDRDGVPRKSLDEIGLERRNGYGWYNDKPASLYKKYRKWASKWDPDGALDLTL